MSIKQNVIFNTIRNLFSIIIPIFSFPYVSRVLKPENIGKSNFSLSFINYFMMLAAMGIVSYGIREAAKIRDDKERLSTFVSEILCINIISSIISYSILFIFIVFSKKLITYRTIILLYSINIISSTLGMEWFFQATERYVYITIRTIILQTLSLICIFIFVRSESDILQYVLISVSTNVLIAITNFVNIIKYIKLRIIKLSDVVIHLKPIFILFLSSIAASIYTSIDSVMLGYITTDRDVGLYAVANKLIKIIISFVTSIFIVLIPRLSYCSEKSREIFSDTLVKSFNALIMISIPVCFGVLALGDEIILLLAGKLYEESIRVIKVLSILLLFIPVSSFYAGQICLPLRLEKKGLIPTSIGCVINVIVNYFLITKYNALGAAIASIIAEFFVMILHIIIFNKYILNISLYKYLYQYFISSLIMFFIIKVTMLFCSTLFLRIIIGTVSGILIYILVLMIFKNPYFIFVIQNVFRRERNDKYCM